MDKRERNLGIASIIGKYKFLDEVWFINDRHIMNGKIHSIKGFNHYLHLSKEIEYQVEYSSGELGCFFDVNERDCFATKQELVNYLLNG